ncbi:MAG: hypothetical protein KIH01_06760, partial [Candidatus Freyarchaeota archaeon]|nr:hypothetical protein [Candidatus Jordarchaeia archaeon]
GAVRFKEGERGCVVEMLARAAMGETVVFVGGRLAVQVAQLGWASETDMRNSPPAAWRASATSYLWVLKGGSSPGSLRLEELGSRRFFMGKPV